MLTNEITIRGLTHDDRDMLKELQIYPDNDFSLYDFIGDDLDNEPSSYGYGLFENGILVAQCSIGGAEELKDCIGNSAFDDELLGDVYVRPDCRRKGYAHKVIDYAVNDRSHKNNNIYCTPYADTENMYRHMGFENVTDDILVMKRH